LERARLHNLIGWRDEEIEDLGTLGIMAEALNDDYRRAIAARQWATLYETSGDYDSGIELIERFVELAQKIGAEQLVGQGYNQWGKLLYLRGKYETAVSYLQQALVIAQKYQDQAVEADCLHNQGLVAYYQADYMRANTVFQTAIELWQKLGHQVGWGLSLSYLGQVYHDMGRYEQARRCYEQSLELHRTIGDRAGEALARHGLGKVERTLGRYEVARHLLEEALTFYQTIGDRHREAQCLYDLGFLYNRQEAYDTALIFLQEALLSLKELRAPWWAQVRAHIYYSWALHNANCLEEARIYIIEAMEIERDTQQKIALLDDMILLGRIALTMGDLSMADSCAQQVLYFVDYQGSQGLEHPVMMYLTCSYILQATGKREQAEDVLAKGQAYVQAQAKQITNPDLRASYLTNVAENRDILALSEAIAVSIGSG
jgi:tetratricopeptide (TPR) repeat protein